MGDVLTGSSLCGISSLYQVPLWLLTKLFWGVWSTSESFVEALWTLFWWPPFHIRRNKSQRGDDHNKEEVTGWTHVFPTMPCFLPERNRIAVVRRSIQSLSAKVQQAVRKGVCSWGSPRMQGSKSLRVGDPAGICVESLLQPGTLASTCK